MIHCDTETMLSCVSLRVESFALRASSVNDMLYVFCSKGSEESGSDLQKLTCSKSSPAGSKPKIYATSYEMISVKSFVDEDTKFR